MDVRVGRMRCLSIPSLSVIHDRYHRVVERHMFRRRMDTVFRQ